MRQPSLKALESKVESFNNKYSVGDKVKIKKYNEVIEVTIKHPASILGGHSAVGWFSEVSGCYDLDLVIE